MATEEYFSGDYVEARDKFRIASEQAGAQLYQYPLSGYGGMNGEMLTIDVATLGAGLEDCDSAFILISGTHGVEGLCGSGCQVGFLRDRIYEAFGRSTRVILVHGLNPFGFSWLRRTNEDNVDLNRNFQNFKDSLPSSAAYEEWHNLLVPKDWDGEARRKADAALFGKIQKDGLPAFQAAVQGGQYSCPDGLFYGGRAMTWSASTFRHILETHVPTSARRVVCFDIHTGLGPTGYGEPILLGSPEILERVTTLLGPEVKVPTHGSSAKGSVSAVVVGTLLGSLEQTFRNAEVTPVALEFGTVPILDVLSALRADNWLHNGNFDSTPLRPSIKQLIRDSFFVDQSFWKAAVYGRTVDLILRSRRGLSGS